MKESKFDTLTPRCNWELCVSDLAVVDFIFIRADAQNEGSEI
jgi:hypothetical protein